MRKIETSLVEGLHLPAQNKHPFGPKYQKASYASALSHCTRFRVAVDAGAHVGIFTRRMREDFDTVYAFEPEPTNFDCLCLNTPHLLNLPMGLGKERTFGRMENPKPINSGAWEFRSDPDGECAIVSLDGLQLTALDLLKMDVQGMELDILEGGEKTIVAHEPVILYETGDPLVPEWLADHGARGSPKARGKNWTR